VTWNLRAEISVQAPELLTGDGIPKNTPQSDIYAFASVCYEVSLCPLQMYQGISFDVRPFKIFTDCNPYFETLSDRYIPILVLIHNKRPSRPTPEVALRTGLSDETWNIMQECWDTSPEKRPTATQICSDERIIEDASLYVRTIGMEPSH
jgi:serine/threonine protein kinase